MDINLKNKNNKFRIIVNLIIIGLLILLSFGIVSFYPELDQYKYKASPYPTMDMKGDIDYLNFILYEEMLIKENGEDFNYSDYIVKDIKENPYKDELKKVSDDFVNELEKRKNAYSEKYKNLQYCIKDSSGNIITNSEESFDKLTNDEDLYNEDCLKELKKKYQYLLKINIDDESIQESYQYYSQDDYDEDNYNEYYKPYNILTSSFKSGYEGILEKHDYEYQDYSLLNDVNNIKNVTIVYAVPKEFKYVDSLSEVNGTQEIYYNDSKLAIITLAIIISFMVISLFVPYFISKLFIGSDIIIKRSLEFNLFISVFGSIALFMLGYVSIYGTLSGDIVKVLTNEFMNYSTANKINYFGNIFAWFLILSFILSEITLIKHFFKTGILNYIRQKSLIVRFYRFVKRNLLGLVNEIDLTDKSDKFIFKIVIINFAIILFFCIIWVFGIGAAIVYSCILFVLLKKYSDEIKQKFGVLLKATNKIAEGNLDVTIDEDLGLFNPFKVEIEKIQKGFKKAVDEEVKSQRMRSELISNVSHDLKTPLTSIITYIDLLKDPNISEEDKNKYIETIDNKVQRLKLLIEDLFEVSKVNSGDIKLELMDVDIIALMKQTQVELADKFEDKGLIIKNNFTDEKIVLNLDGEKTYRVFANLLNNITKYAMANSRVYIDIINDEKCVNITFKNMSAVEMNFNGSDIVERFARGDKSRNTEGSGLGLSIAKSIVELQGGKFYVEVDGDLFKVSIIFNK